MTEADIAILPIYLSSETLRWSTT